MRIGLAILILVAVTGCDNQIFTKKTQDEQPAYPRFQLVMHPSKPEEFTFLLDNQTGELWRRSKYTNFMQQPAVWTREKFLNSLEDKIPDIHISTPLNPESFSEWLEEAANNSNRIANELLLADESNKAKGKK